MSLRILKGEWCDQIRDLQGMLLEYCGDDLEAKASSLVSGKKL